MKMKRLFFAMAICALSGCTTMAASPVAAQAAGVVAKADTVVLTGERAFAVAELAYTTAADGVGVLVDNGVIHGATATTVRSINTTARALLVKGKATADMAEKARIATQLFGFADSLNALKGSN
jgi:hypothetical protein